MKIVSQFGKKQIKVKYVVETGEISLDYWYENGWMGELEDWRYLKEDIFKDLRVYVQYVIFDIERATAMTVEESDLNAIQAQQIKITSYAEFIQKAVKFENNLSTYSRSLAIQDIFEGFVYDGMLSGNGYNRTLLTYQPPVGCQYTGPYRYDVRCRQWFLMPISRAKITPIEPLVFYSQQGSPGLASNLCKRQAQHEADSNGNLQPTQCGYSVNCLNVNLATLQKFFDDTKFQTFKAIMIDPRSQKVLYNSVSGYQSSIRYLQDAAKDLFPSDLDTQTKFVLTIQSKMPKKSTTSLQEGQTTSNSAQCGFDSQEELQLLSFKSFDYASYVEVVEHPNSLDFEYQNSESTAKSFTFKTINGSEVFITINSIATFEKFNTLVDGDIENLKLNGLFELQDWFQIIYILPKELLTSWTDHLKTQIKNYLFYFGLVSFVLCGLFLIVTAVISYQVGIMIEYPLIHMIDLLQRLEKEGGTAALGLIRESEKLSEEINFMSIDLQILFESFIHIFRMVHLATKDIFTVDSSYSLLQLNYQINFFKKFNNKRVLGICYNNIGNIHFQNKRYIEAMENYHYAIVFAYYEAGLYNENQQPYEIKASKFLLTKIRKEDEGEEEDQDSDGQFRYKEEEVLNQIQKDKKEKEKLQHQLKKLGLKRNDCSPLKPRSASLIQQLGPKEQADFKKEEKDLVETILEVIFNRRLNFSQALFMHNISQEATSHSSSSLSSTSIDWEVYEQVLLKLLLFNNQFIKSTYGRSVFLLSQLSLCYLKMGKQEKANFQQGLAIQKYESSLLQEEIARKKREAEFINWNSRQMNPADPESKRDLEMRKEDQIHTESACEFQIQRKHIQNKEQANMYFRRNQKKLLLKGKESSISLLFKKRKAQMKLQSYSISQGKQNPSSIDICQQSPVKQTSQIDVLQPPSLTSLPVSFTEKIEKSNFFQTQQSPNKNEKSDVLIGQTDNQENLLAQTKPKYKRLHNCISSQTIDEIPPIENKSLVTSNPVSQKQLVEQHPKSEKVFAKNLEIPKENLCHAQSARGIQQERKKSTSPKSKINKNLQKEELKQIQRYELPIDILLFQVGIQEARILISEKKKWQASQILTELLEDTQFYLPYHRLMCLNFLNTILQENFLSQDSLKKMKEKFDDEITLRVQTLIAVKSAQSEAASTCIHLVNEVLSKEEDTYSLLVYATNSFQQVMPSLSTKQLRTSQDFFNASISSLNVVSDLIMEESFSEISYSPDEVDDGSQCEPKQNNLSFNPFPFKTLTKGQTKYPQEKLLFGRVKQPRQFNQFLQTHNQMTFRSNLYKCNTCKDSCSSNDSPLVQQSNVQKQTNEEIFLESFYGDTAVLQHSPTLIHSQFSNVVLRRGSIEKNQHASLESDSQKSLHRINKIGLLKMSPLKKINQLLISKDYSAIQSSQTFASPKEPESLKIKDISYYEQSNFHQLPSNQQTYYIENQLNPPKTSNLSSRPLLDQQKTQKYYLKQQILESCNLNELEITEQQFPEILQEKVIYTQNQPKLAQSKGQDIASLVNVPFSKASLLNKENDISKENINLIFHVAVRKAILSFFDKDAQKYTQQKISTQLKFVNKSKKIIIFITDQTGLTQNQAYFMLTHLLYQTQIQLLVLCLHSDQAQNKAQTMGDYIVESTIVIKYFSSQEKLLQYIRNKREPMKHFGIPLLVEHFSI